MAERRLYEIDATKPGALVPITEASANLAKLFNDPEVSARIITRGE